MDELVEAVLTVRTRLSEIDDAGRVRQDSAIHANPLPVGFHVDLLDVGCEARQGLAVREDGAGGVAQEGPIPHADEAEEVRQVLLRSGLQKVHVHVVRSGEEGSHRLVSVVQGERHDAHRRAHAEAPAHPVPEAEHILRQDPERSRLLDLGAQCDDVLARHVLLGNGGHPTEQPITHRARVEHGLRSGEALRHHDHQRLLRVQTLRGAGDVDRIHVSQELEGPTLRGDAAFRVAAERFVHEFRTQVRAADADADHVDQLLAGGSLPRPAAHAVGEVLDLVQHFVHLLDCVRTIHHDRRMVLGSAKRDVHDGAIFGSVDVLSRTHLEALLRHSRRLCQRHQLVHGIGEHILPAVVQRDALVRRDHACAAAGVRQQLAEVRGGGRLHMTLHCAPRVAVLNAHLRS
mmetsp:Transcript_5622/g.22109  ORF Transcript_5622/g.22109 Transcript_5622/m.22109 type:complete len:403 (-) Transcript_5622:78-1286(-)